MGRAAEPGRALDSLDRSATVVTSALMLGVYTILQTADSGWASARTLGLGVLAIVLMAGFLVRQATAARPLLPLGLFRSRTIAGTNTIQVLMGTGMYGMFFLGALYLQRVLGYDPLRIGLAFLPMALLMGLLSFRYAARLNLRFGTATCSCWASSSWRPGWRCWSVCRSQRATWSTSCPRWRCWAPASGWR